MEGTLALCARPRGKICYKGHCAQISFLDTKKNMNIMHLKTKVLDSRDPVKMHHQNLIHGAKLKWANTRTARTARCLSHSRS